MLRLILVEGVEGVGLRRRIGNDKNFKFERVLCILKIIVTTSTLNNFY